MAQEPPIQPHAIANDVPCCGIGDVRLQREDVVGGEGVGESVEDGAVFRVAAGVVSVGGILLAEDVTEEAALLLKNVFGNNQREVDLSYKPTIRI